MSVDKVNSKEITKKDITWDSLIRDSEAEILACRTKINRLRKSIKFFKKQEDSGIPFPTINPHRQSDFS